MIYLCTTCFSDFFFIQEKLIKYPLHLRQENKYTGYTEAKDTILIPYKNKGFWLWNYNYKFMLSRAAMGKVMFLYFN